MLRFLTACVITLTFCGPVFSQDLAVAGEKVFKKCKACHTIGDGAKNKTGPHLNDLFGRQAGVGEDYKYSKAMLAAGEGGLVWTPETLKEYLVSPRKYVPKTKMTFAGLRKPADQEAVTAYLLGFSPEFDAEAAESSN